MADLSDMIVAKAAASLTPDPAKEEFSDAEIAMQEFMEAKTAKEKAEALKAFLELSSD